MNEKFLFGIALGMLGGAVIATNSMKARQLIKDGQTEVLKQVDKMSAAASKPKAAKSKQ